MQTRVVPRGKWIAFFDEFTRQHTGWVTTLWTLGPLVGALVEARDLRLGGIVADQRAIAIHLGGMPGKNLQHPVAAPVSVWLETSEEGPATALGINAADGTTTLLELRNPVPPGLGRGVRTSEEGYASGTGTRPEPP